MGKLSNENFPILIGCPERLELSTFRTTIFDLKRFLYLKINKLQNYILFFSQYSVNNINLCLKYYIFRPLLDDIEKFSYVIYI